MKSGLKYTKMPALKKFSNPYHSTISKISAEQADTDLTEFQLRLQQFYGAGGTQNMGALLPIGLTGDTGFYNPLKNHPNQHGSSTLLNFKPLKPRLPEGLSRKPSTDKMASAEIDFVSSVMRKATLPGTNPLPRKQVLKLPRGSGSAAKLMSFTPLPEDEVKARGRGTTKISKFSSPEAMLGLTKPKSTTTGKINSKAEPTKARAKPFLSAYEKLQVHKHFLRRDFGELLNENKDDSVKNWVQNGARDRRVNASKILGHIIPRQNTAAGNGVPKHKTRRSSDRKATALITKKADPDSTHATETADKEISQFPINPPPSLVDSTPVIETDMHKQGDQAEPSVPAEIVQPRPDAAQESLNEPDETALIEVRDHGHVPELRDSVHRPMSFHFNLNLHTIDGTSGFVNLSDLETIEKQVDLEIQKYAQSFQQKSKRAPVFLITKQGTLVRGGIGAPLTAPKKMVKPSSIGYPIRKWTDGPNTKRYPVKNRLRQFNQVKPKTVNKSPAGQDLDIEQGDRYAEVRAKLTGKTSDHVITKVETGSSGYPQPAFLKKFHDVLQRINTLESKFTEMNVEMSVLHKEKHIFLEYLKKLKASNGQNNENLNLEGSEWSKPDAEMAESTPSFQSSSYGSHLSSSGSPELSIRPNRSTGDMSVSTTGDHALTLQFLETYDSFLSICNDSAEDPTVWSADRKSSKQNIGAYIEQVYERSKVNRRQAPVLFDHFDIEIENEVLAEDEDALDVQEFSPNLDKDQDNPEETALEPSGLSQLASPMDQDGFQSWKPESELESDFQDQSEDYYGENEASGHEEAIPGGNVAKRPEVERLYENEDFDYLYETKAPPQESPSTVELKRRISRNELETSLQVTLVNSQAFPFTNLERSVLCHLEELPESPNPSDTSGFLSPIPEFEEKSSLAKLSTVTLPFDDAIARESEPEPLEINSEMAE